MGSISKDVGSSGGLTPEQIYEEELRQEELAEQIAREEKAHAELVAEAGAAIRQKEEEKTSISATDTPQAISEVGNVRSNAARVPGAALARIQEGATPVVGKKKSGKGRKPRITFPA